MEQKKCIAAGPEWAAAPLEGFQGTVFDRVGKGWMLISAAAGRNAAEIGGDWNTMTASWGLLGVLWRKNVGVCFVRDSRYTFDFMNKAEIYSLSFFNEAERDALSLLGTKSGRDMDKVTASGLTPVVFETGPGAGGIGFREAVETFVCRKIYTDDIKPELFLSPDIAAHYPEKDYHRMYVGEILARMVKG
jgi:flavin reductase (DIM6/NTAB) family NADH-FMN oxidoreductase RutF